MSATGTPTPNIGLRIPLGTDPASVDDINYNSNLIDTKLGAVGNDSVQDQIDDLNSKIAVNAPTVTLKTGFSLASWGWIRAVKTGNICIVTFSGLQSSSAISSETDMATVSDISPNGLHFNSMRGAGGAVGLVGNNGNTIRVNNMDANSNYFGELVMAIN